MSGGYVVDTSVWIDMGKMYVEDIFPSLWVNLDGLITANMLVVPREVHREVLDPAATYNWMKARPALIAAPDVTVEATVKVLVNKYAKLVDPLSTGPNADPHVIALAQKRGFTVVSAEKPKFQKIPDVCKSIGVAHFGMFEFFRAERFRF